MQLPEEAKPVNSLNYLSAFLQQRLCQWVDNVVGAPGFCYPNGDAFAHPQATEIVEVFDRALVLLESKTGSRADAAREQIRAVRAPIAVALDLVNSLKNDFSGPLALDLQRRIASTRAALASALQAKELATSDKIESALIAVEKAWANVRELSRDLDSIYARLILPWKVPGVLWPDVDDLRRAVSATRALVQQSSKQPSAAQVYAAIGQGLETPAHVAALWVAYEDPDHSLIKWRARAFAERYEAPQAVAAE